MSAKSVHSSVVGVSALPLAYEVSMFVALARTDESYVVNVYGSSDGQQDAAFNSSFEVGKSPVSKNTFTGSMRYLVDPKSVPYFLHFDVYSIGPDPEHGLQALLPFCIGSVALRRVVSAGKGGFTVSCIDIEGHEQAQLTLKAAMFTDTGSGREIDTALVLGRIPLRPHAPIRESRLRSGEAFSDALIRKAVDAYELARGKHRRQDEVYTFASYSTVFGPRPMLSFVYAARRCTADRSAFEAFLSHLMSVAGANLGRRLDEFKRCPDDVKGNWLTETCTVYFRGQMYVHDSVRASRAQMKRSTDNWSLMASFPAHRFTAFDCEDGACWIMSLLNLLQHGEFAQEPLRELQAFANHYCALFTLGELRATTGMVAHAYVCLLDKNFVAGRRGIEFKPALTCESTTYTAGAWTSAACLHESAASEAEDIRFIDSQQVFTKLPGNSTARWMRVCKSRAPVSVVLRRGMYGTVWALLGELPDGSYGHFIVNDSAGNVGVRPLDLYQYSSKVSLTQALSVPREQLSSLDDTLTEFPRSKMPLAPAAKQEYPLLDHSRTRFAIRAHDFDKNFAEWKHAFSATIDPDFVFAGKRVDLTDDGVSVVFVDL